MRRDIAWLEIIPVMRCRALERIAEGRSCSFARFLARLCTRNDEREATEGAKSTTLQTNNPTFNSFYGQYYHLVYGYLRKQTGNSQDAEDLAADVFLSCYKALDSYDPEKASVTTWLFVIVNNRLKNYWRGKRPRARASRVAEEDWGVQGPSIMLRSMMLEDTRKQIAGALEHLDERQRQIVVCKFFQQMTAAEIAEKMEMSESNVRVTLHRALKEMRRYVQ